MRTCWREAAGPNCVEIKWNEIGNSNRKQKWNKTFDAISGNRMKTRIANISMVNQNQKHHHHHHRWNENYLNLISFRVNLIEQLLKFSTSSISPFHPCSGKCCAPIFGGSSDKIVWIDCERERPLTKQYANEPKMVFRIASSMHVSGLAMGWETRCRT